MKMFTWTILLIATLMLFSGMASAEIETDKIAHFGVGYMITDISQGIGQALKIEDSIIRDIVLPLATTILFASGKEFIDSQWDWNDWGYTVAGSGLKIGIKFTF